MTRAPQSNLRTYFHGVIVLTDLIPLSGLPISKYNELEQPYKRLSLYCYGIRRARLNCQMVSGAQAGAQTTVNIHETSSAGRVCKDWWRGTT